MSFLRNLVAKTVMEKAMNTAMHGFINHMENTRSVDAIVNNSTVNYMLIIKKKSFSIKRGFSVYDEINTKKYEIKTDVFTFGYPCIHLYDTEDNEIGKVKLTSKEGMEEYTMFLDGEKLGTISRIKGLKKKFELSFNSWHLDGNLMQNRFSVTDKNGNTVMNLTDTFSSRSKYILKMNSYEHEILGLLLVMTIEIAIHGNR